MNPLELKSIVESAKRSGLIKVTAQPVKKIVKTRRKHVSYEKFSDRVVTHIIKLASYTEEKFKVKFRKSKQTRASSHARHCFIAACLNFRYSPKAISDTMGFSTTLVHLTRYRLKHTPEVIRFLDMAKKIT